MNRQIYDDRLITDYLLGSLSSDETERLDEVSFTDDEFAQRLQAVENDLVDAYVRGELHGSVLERFESFYLSFPGEKVTFARSFLRVADEAVPFHPSQQVWWKANFRRPLPVWLSLAAAAVLAVVLGWLVVQDVRLRQQRDEARTERETFGQRATELQAEVGAQQAAVAEKQKQIDELRNALARLEAPSPAAEPRIVPFVLRPQTRGIGRIAAVSVPAGTDFLTFQLELEGDDHTSYRAALKSIPGGETIWSRSGLSAQRRDDTNVLVVSLRAPLLNPQDYIWELSGRRAGRVAEAAGSYVFRVMKE